MVDLPDPAAPTTVDASLRGRLSGGGLYEDIEILGISGANATVRNPLINDYASGATLTAMRYAGLRWQRAEWLLWALIPLAVYHLYSGFSWWGARAFGLFWHWAPLMYIGMFAFAAWDRHERRLVLARDRLGKKPLYWSRQGNFVSFGSELKALAAGSRFVLRRVSRPRNCSTAPNI